MKFNQLLLASSFMALMILPACDWFKSSNNEPEVVVIEEVVMMEPEVETLQDQQLDDQELEFLNEK